MSCYININCKGRELVLFGLINQRHGESLNNIGVGHRQNPEGPFCLEYVKNLVENSGKRNF